MEDFQSRIPNNNCYGCGPGNIDGLRIKSYWVGEDLAECRFQPSAHHSAGPDNCLNGGIIATLIDCHCVCTAIAKAYALAGREIGWGEEIWYVTGKLSVSYQRPVPLSAEVILRAAIETVSEKKTTITCDLFSNADRCARGEVVAVRVPGQWKSARTRLEPPNASGME